MYKERIIQHYKNPSNNQEPESNCFDSSEAHNPSCGDSITGYVRVKDDQIKEINFTGEGCAISMASASILSERMVGTSVSEAKTYNREEVLDALGIEVTPMRLKCALLPRDAFVQPLD